MGTMKGIAGCLLIISLTGCASRSDFTNLERDAGDTRRRVIRLEREMEGVRQTASDEVQNSLKTFRKELDMVRKSAADIQASQDTVRVDMQEQSGKIDDLNILVKKHTEEKKFEGEEAERRLAGLEARLAALEKELAAVKGSSGSPTTTTPNTAEGLYQAALATFKSGDMAKARNELSRVIEMNPHHDLVANAQYWIGETYYGEKNYDQAILAFQDVISKYPKKDKAPAALLKQALSFKALADKKSARYLLRKLQEDYPRSDEAKRVPALLKELP